MKHVSVLIKPFSSVCNIRCKYCFYEDVSNHREVKSYGKMSSETATQMVINLFKDLDAGDHLTLAFQGGEPTLAGLPFYRHLVAEVEKQLCYKPIYIHYSIQTNGILINKRWCAFLKEYHFLVDLSIDGNPIYHDLNRVDMKGRGTFQKVLKTKQLLDDYGIDYNVLCVLTNGLAKEASKVYHFIRQQNIRYIQFIPCLGSLDTATKTNYELRPQRFFLFYRKLFSLWYRDLCCGTYISIKLFDDIFRLLVRGEENFCGIRGNCSIQYVIEADGSVYPCDFYVLDDYKMGQIQEEGLRTLSYSSAACNFLCSRKELPGLCRNCPVFNLCRGGCKRMVNQMYVDEKEQYCGYQRLLEFLIPKVDDVVRMSHRIKS